MLQKRVHVSIKGGHVSGNVYYMDMFPGIFLLHDITNANYRIKKIIPDKKGFLILSLKGS